ncbi:MAG: NAD(P)H-hydrate dehydratase, partial [Candidatus Hydrogenedentes bacterium]|nr:NAD(P)H-hydrate dehydratase [Candidatus Hydrogenedentota bacterium]
MTTELSATLVHSLLPKRPDDAHKGAFGHLFVVAGSRGFTGAARMVCEAAMRSGVGLVTLGVPAPLADVMASVLVEVMTRPFPATDAESFGDAALEAAVRFASQKDAVAIGPGLSQHPETVRFVQEFVKKCPVRLAIDADALNAMSRDMQIFDHVEQPCILTPHPGEMARLLGVHTAEVQKDREKAAKTLAARTHKVAVLKGHHTVIAHPQGEVVVSPPGNSGMATAGTGDVLTGMLGSLMAQGMDAWDAARLGVYVHGLAGDIAAQRMTKRAMIATDLLHA